MHRLLQFGLALGVALALAGCAMSSGGSQPTQVQATPAREGDVVEGCIVPLADVTLTSGIAGRIAEVLVREGDSVAQGQVLLRLDDGQLRAQVAEAEAGLAAARAELAKLEAGARAELVAVAEAAVQTAQANLGVARSQLASATDGVAVASGQVARARAALADLAAGPTQQDMATAEAQVRMAENDLWGAQAVRDSTGGAVGRGQASGANLDEAEAGIGLAQEALGIARLQVEKVKAGPRSNVVAEARAAVQIAEAQKAQSESLRAVAEAQVQVAAEAVRQAEAESRLVRAGASANDLERARAGVAGAEASLQAAKLAADEATLRAPMAGIVARLDAKVGQRSLPGNPLVVLADTSAWEVETKDLTEQHIIGIVPGSRVTLVPDVLPDAQFQATVRSIRPAYEEKLGDVTYTVRLALDQTDARLRWGMTVSIGLPAQ